MNVGELVDELNRWNRSTPVAIVVYDELVGIAEVGNENTYSGDLVVTIVAMRGEGEEAEEMRRKEDEAMGPDN